MKQYVLFDKHGTPVNIVTERRAWGKALWKHVMGQHNAEFRKELEHCTPDEIRQAVIRSVRDRPYGEGNMTAKRRRGSCIDHHEHRSRSGFYDL